ncbi:MAG: hypothetical protein GX351_07555 [Peptococcaceae bacterium]|nr:hypothetical protein [Peptococcaceae bacterium]
MEQNVKPFEQFVPGSHLILGEAGSGKTRLIWSILQRKSYREDNSINIVLTDSEKKIWYNPPYNPVTILDPFDSDINWATNPEKPGIYYCACDYAPRVTTFLECLATWAIQHEREIKNKVRVFIDFPSKYWTQQGFVEQLIRLHYIAASQDVDNQGHIEIWAVLTSLGKISAKASPIFESSNLLLLNPMSETWLAGIKDSLKTKCENVREFLSQIDKSLKEGFYYIPCSGNELYVNKKAIDNLGI